MWCVGWPHSSGGRPACASAAASSTRDSDAAVDALKNGAEEPWALSSHSLRRANIAAVFEQCGEGEGWISSDRSGRLVHTLSIAAAGGSSLSRAALSLQPG